MPDLIPLSLKIVIELLNVSGSDVKTLCGSRIYGTYSEDFTNTSPGIVLSTVGGFDYPDMPVQNVQVEFRCYGGANDDGSGASETYQALNNRLKDVFNESTASGRVLSCVQDTTEQLAIEDATLWAVSSSTWSILIATS